MTSQFPSSQYGEERYAWTPLAHDYPVHPPHLALKADFDVPIFVPTRTLANPTIFLNSQITNDSRTLDLYGLNGILSYHATTARKQTAVDDEVRSCGWVYIPALSHT